MAFENRCSFFAKEGREITQILSIVHRANFPDYECRRLSNDRVYTFIPR